MPKPNVRWQAGKSCCSLQLALMLLVCGGALTLLLLGVALRVGCAHRSRPQFNDVSKRAGGVV